MVCDQINDSVMTGFPLPSMAALPLPSVLHIVLRVDKDKTHYPYEGNFPMLGNPRGYPPYYDIPRLSVPLKYFESQLLKLNV